MAGLVQRDASTLLMPAVGMVVPSDEKWASTMAAMDKTLVTDSLVYRYDPRASPDGLRDQREPSRCAPGGTLTR
jgi:GH15 family glucan-1,4-alpha-glucosidase